MTEAEDYWLDKLVKTEFLLEAAQKEIATLTYKLDQYELAKIQMFEKIQGLSELLVYGRERLDEYN